LAVCLTVLFFARKGHAVDSVRALTFATLIIASLVLITVNRSWTRPFLAILRAPNAAFRWVVGGALALLAVVLYVPLAQRLLHFGPVHPTELALGAGGALACLLWFEALKRLGLVAGLVRRPHASLASRP
jgi:Ca2+-transporting ATPase